MPQSFETYRGIVYPWSIDHMGHLNVASYTARFDEASWHFFAQIGLNSAFLKANGFGLVALEQKTHYKLEILAGALINIRTELLEVNRKTFRFLHRMFNSETEEEVATTELVAAFFDTSIRRAAVIPDDIANRARGLL